MGVLTGAVFGLAVGLVLGLAAGVLDDGDPYPPNPDPYDPQARGI